MQKVGHSLLSMAQEFPRRHLMFAAAVTGCLLAVLLYPQTDVDTRRQFAASIPLTVQEPAPEDLVATPHELELFWKEPKVAKGDSLSLIFQRAKLSAKDVYQISSSKQ